MGCSNSSDQSQPSTVQIHTNNQTSVEPITQIIIAADHSVVQKAVVNNNTSDKWQGEFYGQQHQPSTFRDQSTFDQHSHDNNAHLSNQEINASPQIGNSKHLKVPKQGQRQSEVGENARQQNTDMMFYDETMLLEQAIHQSLQDNNASLDDVNDFEKELQMVMKESKIDYEIDQRRKNEEEIKLISQIPELRNQKIQEIINQVPENQRNKLQPLQGLPKVQIKLHNAVSNDDWANHSLKQSDKQKLKDPSMKAIYGEPSVNISSQQLSIPDNFLLSKKSSQSTIDPAQFVKTVQYTDYKKSVPIQKSENQSNWYLGDDLGTNDGQSKPSFQMSGGLGNDYQNQRQDTSKNDIDLDELKAFLDEGYTVQKGSTKASNSHRNNAFENLNQNQQSTKRGGYDEETILDDFL